MLDMIDMLENFKIVYCPDYASAKEYAEEHDVLTIEAVYGSEVVEGRLGTLDHHAEGYRDNPAPCNADIEPLKSGTILVSHMDVDCMGGIMAAIGIKPENPSLWQTAERIDLTGPSNLADEPQMNQDEMRALYIALRPIQEEMRQLVAADKDKTGPKYYDITQSVKKLAKEFSKIADRENPEREPLLEEGRRREAERIKNVESKCVYDDGVTRGFKTEPGIGCNNAYAPPGREEPAIACVSYDSTGTLIISFNSKINMTGDSQLRNPDCKLNARNIIKSVYGKDFGEDNQAGGHPGIAGSPRGINSPPEYYDKAIATVVPMAKVLKENQEKDFKLYINNKNDNPAHDIATDIKNGKYPVFEIIQKEDRISLKCYIPEREHLPEENRADSILSLGGNRDVIGQENHAVISYPQGTSLDSVCKELSGIIEKMPQLEPQREHEVERNTPKI